MLDAGLLAIRLGFSLNSNLQLLDLSCAILLFAATAACYWCPSMLSKIRKISQIFVRSILPRYSTWWTNHWQEWLCTDHSMRIGNFIPLLLTTKIVVGGVLQSTAITSLKLVHGDSQCINEMFNENDDIVLKVAASSNTGHANAHTLSIMVGNCFYRLKWMKPLFTWLPPFPCLSAPRW